MITCSIYSKELLSDLKYIICVEGEQRCMAGVTLVLSVVEWNIIE